jgi:dynein heavy chain
MFLKVSSLPASQQVPVDTLNFVFIIKSMERDDDVSNAPDDGVYISGLFLEAARWDRRHKKLRTPNVGEMMSLMPVIHFNCMAHYSAVDLHDYQAPLYKTNLRAGVLNTTGQSTNYILDVGLPTDEPPHFWILMATALCTMTND